MQIKLRPTQIEDLRMKVANVCGFFAKDGPDLAMVDNCNRKDPIVFLTNLNSDRKKTQMKLFSSRNGKTLIVSISSKNFVDIFIKGK